jgi:hypothetical protein
MRGTDCSRCVYGVAGLLGRAAGSQREAVFRRTAWEGRPETVRARYSKGTEERETDPKYCGTRGIPWESGRTTS